MSNLSERGQGALILLVFAALLVVGIVFVALPMLGLGIGTADALSGALGQ